MEIKEVTSGKALREFIYLPEKIHKGHKNWTPSLYADEWKYFNPKTNPAFEYCDTILALCYCNGKPVGRIMGIINHRYNNIRNEKNGRFGLLECTDDAGVAAKLLNFVEMWLRNQGMTRIIGPCGMNYFDPQGFLFEGFGYSPPVATYFNFEYMSRLMEQSGYSGETEMVVYRIELPNKIPDLYYRIRERLFEKKVFQLVEFTSGKEVKENARSILKLMNECFRDIYSYSFLEEAEMDHIGKQYLALLDPRLVKVVKRGEEMAGFIVAMPHMSDGLRKARGRLLPFGFLQIRNALRKTSQIDLLIGGVRTKYQGTGIDVVLGMSMIETAIASGFRVMDSHLELASNFRIRAEMERMGGKVYKKYRIYGKDIPEQTNN